MSRLRSFIMLAVLFPPTVLQAAEDSTRLYHAREVVVTATRSGIPAADSPSPTVMIPVASAPLTTSTTVADLLRPVAGLFIRDNGPNGQMKTVSLRGLTSEHVMILLDGVRVNSMQNGLADLALLPLANLDRIEVVRGGSSAFYGGDASAGVINLLTRDVSSGTTGSIESSTGSFGFQRIAGSLSLGTENAGLTVGSSWEEGDDNYGFTIPRAGRSDTTMRYDNADYSRLAAFANVIVHLNEHTSVRATLSGVRARRGIPGPVIPDSGFAFSRARQWDDLVHASAAFRTSVGALSFALNAGTQYGWEQYDDASWPSRYRTVTMTVNPHVEYLAMPWYRITAGLEYIQGTLEGSDFEGDLRRIQRGIYFSNEFSFQRAEEFLDRFTVLLTGRYDRTTTFGDAFTPKAGINVRIWAPMDLRLRGGYSRNFRVPTFNDLAFRFFGNADLKPEHSTTSEAGFLFSVGEEFTHDVDVTYFVVSSRDRILFDPVRWIPMNLGRVESDGWEIRYKGTSPRYGVTATIDAALITAGGSIDAGLFSNSVPGQLPYVPQHSGNIGLRYASQTVALEFLHSIVSRRSTGVSIRPWLRWYGRTDIRAGYTAVLSPATIQFALEISNIFDQDYEIYYSYPMPGRAFRIGAKVEI